MSPSNTPPPYGPAVHYTAKHLFFYGYELQLPEARLQNWYPASFTDPNIPGVRFQTGEHYIMYRKALVMGDTLTANKIASAATPKEAGRLGREVKTYDGDKWNQAVDEVAETCNYLKCSQVEECRQALLGSGDRILAEASPVDRNWGIGFRGDEAENKVDEWGRNILGKALMKVRDRLRIEQQHGEA
ncbi:hypothetical protein LTR67_007319 [Exophiala xenobiotica]|jgi:ribA/ribD-fused uncharacterized protein